MRNLVVIFNTRKSATKVERTSTSIIVHAPAESVSEFSAHTASLSKVKNFSCTLARIVLQKNPSANYVLYVCRSLRFVKKFNNSKVISVRAEEESSVFSCVKH